MPIYAVSIGTSFEGNTRHFYEEMFHGLAFHNNVNAPPWASNSNESSPRIPINLVKNGHAMPDVFKPACNLIVSERVMSELAHLPGIEFQGVRFLRLFNYPWSVGDESFAQDPDWLRYLNGICADDPWWFSFSRPHNYDTEMEIGKYYELLTHSREYLLDRYFDAKPIDFAAGHAHLSKEMLEESAIVCAPGCFMTEEAFSLLKSWLDPHFFRYIAFEVDWSATYLDRWKPRIIGRG